VYGAETLTDDRAPAEVEKAYAMFLIEGKSIRVRRSTISSLPFGSWAVSFGEPSETPGFASPPHGGFALVEESSPNELSAGGKLSLSAGE
jgi:hypothetical protein